MAIAPRFREKNRGDPCPCRGWQGESSSSAAAGPTVVRSTLNPCASPTRKCRPSLCGSSSRNLSPATARTILRSSSGSRQCCLNSMLAGSSCNSVAKPKPATSCRWTDLAADGPDRERQPLGHDLAGYALGTAAGVWLTRAQRRRQASIPRPRGFSWIRGEKTTPEPNPRQERLFMTLLLLLSYVPGFAACSAAVAARRFVDQIDCL